MGQSTDAILFYGYCWEDEARNPWSLHPDRDSDAEDDEEWEDRYARLVHDLHPPSEPYPSRQFPWNMPREKQIYPPDEQAIVDKYRAYWSRKRELAAESGVAIYTHCSSDCPMPYVCVASTHVSNSRGSRTEITAEMLAVDPTWEPKLRAFCEQMKIPVPDEGPKWWLVSDWS
jgi:hypothetical protein